MSIPTQVLAGLVGLLLGAASFIGFRSKLAAAREPGAPAVPPGKLRLWKFLAWFDLIVFPIVGYYIPVIFKGL
jgi:hypothetical protein